MSASTAHAPARLLPGSRPARWLPLLLALLGGAATLLTLDTADEIPGVARGPGLTFDEGFNVEVGAYLVESLLRSGWAGLHPATWAEIFNAPHYNPDHPPLGRLAIGLSNALFSRLFPLEKPRFYSVSFARPASALAYALLIGIVARFCLLRFNPIAALAAGLSLILMPRLFAHAHLAALESWMNLTYTAFVLGVLHCWVPHPASNESSRTPAADLLLGPRDGLIPGLLLGLALLTKMQAVVLPPILVLWALWYWKRNAILPLLVCAAVSAAVFVIGWPWLWPAPVSRSLEYFARSTERITLYCFYLGERFADREVPWHYPFVMFAVTTPLIWLLLGSLGISTAFLKNRESSPPQRLFALLLAAFVAPLLLFALPGVAVYDGVRLFLVSWPIFAIFVGWGFSELVRRGQSCGRATRWSVGGGLLLLLISPIISMSRLHPIHLSYYNELTGGLRGAAALGFERTYWGDSVTPDFLEACSGQLPEGTRLGMAPVLHPLNPLFMKTDSWLRLRPDLSLVVYDDQQPAPPRYVIHIPRQADPWASLTPPPPGTKTRAQVIRDGVVLAELLELPMAAGSENSEAPHD